MTGHTLDILADAITNTGVGGGTHITSGTGSDDKITPRNPPPANTGNVAPAACAPPTCQDFSRQLAAVNGNTPEGFPTMEDLQKEGDPNQVCANNCKLFQEQMNSECNLLRLRMEKFLRDRGCPSKVVPLNEPTRQKIQYAPTPMYNPYPYPMQVPVYPTQPLAQPTDMHVDTGTIWQSKTPQNTPKCSTCPFNK